MKKTNGWYNGKDEELERRFPLATECRKACGYACDCGNCKNRVQASFEYPGAHPTRCKWRGAAKHTRYNIIRQDGLNAETYAVVYDAIEAARIEDALRRKLRTEDPDGARLGCYVRTDAELKRDKDAQERWEALTEREKRETVEINGRKYVKAIYCK